jgi:hypothetical protein
MLLQVVIAHCVALVMLLLNLKLWHPLEMFHGGRAGGVATMLVLVFIPIAIGTAILSSKKKKKGRRERYEPQEDGANMM